MRISFWPASLFSLSGLSKRIGGYGNNDRCFHSQVPPGDPRVVCGPVSVHSLHVCLWHHELPSLPDSQWQCVSHWWLHFSFTSWTLYFLLSKNVSDILHFRLTAIRDHSSGMKLLQKKAFVNRLLQSSVVGDVSTWPPYFLSSILPLLPYLPVSTFQQLTSQQVRGHLTNDNTYRWQMKENA